MANWTKIPRKLLQLVARHKRNVFPETFIRKLCKHIFSLCRRQLRCTVPNWAELPPELLRLVARQLSQEDYFNFAAVCTTWRTVAIENYNPKTRPPWLIDSINTANFFPIPPLEKGRQLPRELGFGIRYIYQGWIAKGSFCQGLTLFNPLSRAAIKLPALKMENSPSFPFSHFSFYYLLATSASPSQSVDCSVMISFKKKINFKGDFEQHTWAWRSKQGAWAKVRVPPASDITQLIHYRGRFVALDRQFQILTLDEDDVVEGGFAMRVHLNEALSGCFSPYLMECSGSLLLVGTLLVGGESNMFRVIEVDLERSSWRELKSLGNASLFLNEQPYCSSFSVAELDSIDMPASCWFQPNCIYYFETIETEPKLRSCIMIYHMEDGHSERKFEERLSTCLRWIQPSF